MDEHTPPKKCPRLENEDVSSLSKEELLKQYEKQQEQIEQLKNKLNIQEDGDDNSEKSKNIPETSRRENVLVMRLANKEQEIQEFVAQINHSKKVQEDAALLSLQQTNLDPGINLLFGKMREELQQTKSKLAQAESELSAWKLTPDSQNGKKLISRCRTLIAENQDLGRQLSQGKSAQLEAELALQKKYNDELKSSQDELNEFVIQLDEEVEGMQSTIQVLQQQLVSAKRENEGYKEILDSYKNDVSLDDERKYLSNRVKEEQVRNSGVLSDSENADDVSRFSPNADNVRRINPPYYLNQSDNNRDQDSDMDCTANDASFSRTIRTLSKGGDKTRDRSVSPCRGDDDNEFDVCDAWDDEASTDSGGSNRQKEISDEVDTHEIISNASCDERITSGTPLSSRDYSSGDENADSDHEALHHKFDSNFSRSDAKASNNVEKSNASSISERRFDSDPRNFSPDANSSDSPARTADQVNAEADEVASLLAYCRKMLSQAPCEKATDKKLLADLSHKLSTFAADSEKELDLNSLQVIKNAIQSLLRVHSEDSSNEDNHFDSRNGLDVGDTH